MSEDQYVGIHQKIREKAIDNMHKEFGGKRTAVKEYVAPTQGDLDEIKLALKYILEKLTQLDMYVRKRQFDYVSPPGKEHYYQPENRLENKDK